MFPIKEKSRVRMAISSVVQVLRVRKLKSYRPDGVKWLEKAADKNNDTALREVFLSME